MQVGAFAATATKKASQQKLKKAEHQKQGAKAERTQKKAERKSIAASKAERGKRSKRVG
jgi:hypothetical protein